MRKLGLLSASIATAALLAGCGGGGGGSSSKVTRTVAGFVYVLGGTGTANPNAIIIPSAVAPSGFFAPTSGTVTLSVPDGSISRAPDNEPFIMATSNAVICSVSANEGTLITTSGSGLNFEGAARSFNSFTTNIGTKANSSTVLVLNNGGSTYTPGAPASLVYTIGGVPLDNPPADPVQFITGAPAAATTLNVVALDESGVIVPSTQFTVAASNAGVAVGSSPGAGPFSLTPAGMAQAEGAVDITIDTTGANLQATINGNFTHGTATTVLVGVNNATIWWNTTTTTDTPENSTVTATVNNQYGIAMPNQAVAFSTDKIPSSGNAWSAVDGSLTGNAFATQNGNTNGSGQFQSTFATPGDIDGPLSAPATNPKGVNVITATSGSASGTVNVTILRPIGALVIAGDLTLDTGNSGINYTITGATDVDGATATIPSGGVTWTLTNTVAGGNTIGNVGDTSPRSVSTSSTNGATSGTTVVGAGTTAGQFTLQAAIGSVLSNTLTVEVYGVPSKIFLNPNTAASVIAGANGEYAAVGTLNPTFTFLDSFGHAVGGGGNGGTATWQYTGNIESATGGSLNPGSGANVSGFTIVSGPGDGLFTITTQGSWTGSSGGSGNFNLQKSVGHNAP